ncbi:biotin-dependent carboxyltransferase family protein [Epibacterium ulvae]|uniref:5-oxoprolinase subunit C family protein n=1 Tax=Epibacterium ulvae TaxID=1156985 RepID=UPI001BFC4905|nr:biotin-dependent carboxyltransferase family protein [Epibacterium ulvae]MBT8153654.1 biotin-dependent carboxyltransferase family protein [Epibacterium ulvae]
MTGLKVLKSGPSLTLQDQGRPGFLGNGVSRGGAADLRGVAEGASLLGQSPELAVLEMAGFGGSFEATGDVRIALTGAPMTAVVDGQPVAWNASHQLRAGQVLEIGTAHNGVYGYLQLGGGIEGTETLGAVSAHLAAGLGRRTEEGDVLIAGPDSGTQTGLCLPLDPRFEGGEIRIVESFQSDMFSPETRQRFAETVFLRGARANRMGVEMRSDGEGFAARDQLNILSEIIVPGDVQLTGDGRPFVLMRECQTTGGYPRIGSVVPCDLNKVAQAGLGSSVRFKWIGLDDALEIEKRHAKECQTLRNQCAPLRRDPADIPDLLSYQLIGGVISADQDPFS